MNGASKVLIDQALELSVLERASIAEQLLLSLNQPDPKLDAIWAEEAEARLAAYERGDLSAHPMSEVFHNRDRS